jgi:hypothetical protein
MEVAQMGRRRSRVTVPLVGVMVLTLGVGSGVYYAKARRKAAREREKAVASAVAATTLPAVKAPAKADPEAGAVVTQTPEATALAATNTPPAAATTEPVIRVTEAAATRPTTQGTVASFAATRPGGPVVLPGDAAGALVEGKGKIDAGDLVGGRKVLNDALLSGGLSATDAGLAKQLMAEANKAIVFSPRRFGNDPFQSTHTVQAREMLQKIAAANALSWEFLGRINGLSDPRRMRAGATLKTVQGPFHAVVSKSAFTMDIYLGSPGKPGGMYVTTLPVGLGQNDSTPTGTWMAGGKLKNPAYFSPRGEGVIAADDPKNPLGEYWISLQGVEGQAVGKMSYGVHGTIDPDSIGKQSSMGCIRLRNDDIALVYELLVEGKSIVVVKD